MTLATAFKSSEGETAFREAYDAAMNLWPVPYEEIEVPSCFGMTHVVSSGPQDAPPLLLLHAFMATLTMWSPYIEAFSRDFRVYAIDIMGHPNKSVPDEPIRDGADYVAWLGKTLDGLNLDHVGLAGYSFGGWISLYFTMSESERVRKLVLLSPAASFQPISMQFNLRAMLTGLIPVRGTMDSLMKWAGFEASSGDTVTRGVLDLMWIGGKNIRISSETRRIMPSVFSDEELRALQVPALLLIGEDEVLYDAEAAVARARRLIPNLEGELVPDCSHEMCLSQHRIVEARVLEFLNDEGA